MDIPKEGIFLAVQAILRKAPCPGVKERKRVAVRLSGRFLFVVSCLVISCTAHNAIPYPSDQILMDRLCAHESIFASLASDPSSKKNLEKLNIIACYSLRENASVDTFVVWKKDIVGPGGGTSKAIITVGKPPCRSLTALKYTTISLPIR